MNRIFNRITLTVMSLVTIISLTGCTNDDVDQADDLNGYWEGSIEGNYYSDRYGGNESWDTEIWFVQEGDFSNGGYGREIDYSRHSGRTYTTDFDWEVHNGRIYMDYHDGYRVIIRDYELYSVGSGMRFRGYFQDYDTGETMASFNLVKTGGWSDWAKKHTTDFGGLQGE